MGVYVDFSLKVFAGAKASVNVALQFLWYWIEPFTALDCPTSWLCCYRGTAPSIESSRDWVHMCTMHYARTNLEPFSSPLSCQWICQGAECGTRALAILFEAVACAKVPFLPTSHSQLRASMQVPLSMSNTCWLRLRKSQHYLCSAVMELNIWECTSVLARYNAPCSFPDMLQVTACTPSYRAAFSWSQIKHWY